METDMTQGRPLPIILKFTLPLMVGNIFQQLYNMADTIIVGHFVGEDALAAVGSTGTIMFLVLGFAVGLSSGFTVLTSQKYGAGDYESTKQTVSNAVILSAIMAVVITILSVGAMRPLLHLMNTPANIFEDAYSYISVICMGVTASVFYNLFSACLRAVGNSRVPLYFLVFSACMNVVLDLVFIILFGFGVSGAAWATNISQGISAILCLIYIYKKMPMLAPKGMDWKFHKRFARYQLAIGMPMALQFGITASGTIVMQSAINSFGSVAVASVTAASKIQNIVTQGMVSVGQTMAAYTGQNYGKMDIKRIREGITSAMKVTVIYSIVCSIAICLALPYILGIFFSADTSVADMLPTAKIYIYQCAACYIPLSFIYIFRNAMQGCGYGFLPMVGGIVEFFARLIAAFFALRFMLFNFAVGCDPIAWLSAGLFTGIAWIFVRRSIEKKGFSNNVETQQ